jgi:isocitrate/isopropylmalate dehydrogenase
MTNNHLNIAVIPGDGIGTEVVPEGLRVLDVAAKRHNIDIRFDEFDFAGCRATEKTGSAGTMPCSSAPSAGPKPYRTTCRFGGR